MQSHPVGAAAGGAGLANGHARQNIVSTESKAPDPVVLIHNALRCEHSTQRLPCLPADGKPIPTELRREEQALRKRIELEDDNTAVPRSHVDDEYAHAEERDPKILVTTSRDPSTRLVQFAKEVKLVLPNAQRINRGGQVRGQIPHYWCHPGAQIAFGVDTGGQSASHFTQLRRLNKRVVGQRGEGRGFRQGGQAGLAHGAEDHPQRAGKLPPGVQCLPLLPQTQCYCGEQQIIPQVVQ